MVLAAAPILLPLPPRESPRTLITRSTAETVNVPAPSSHTPGPLPAAVPLMVTVPAPLLPTIELLPVVAVKNTPALLPLVLLPAITTLPPFLDTILLSPEKKAIPPLPVPLVVLLPAAVP